MRVVLDTNVVASALLWGGTPERLIELAGEGALELITSEALLAELAGILGRPKFVEKLRQKNLAAAGNVPDVIGKKTVVGAGHRVASHKTGILVSKKRP